MKSILLIAIMMIIMIVPDYSFNDKSAIEPIKTISNAEYEKQFRESIDAECKAMVPRVWRECSTWKQIEGASNERNKE